MRTLDKGFGLSIERKMRHCGATTCKFWLTNHLWNDTLPVKSPPQTGIEVVDFFINVDAQQQTKDAFIRGWDTYLKDPTFLG